MNPKTTAAIGIAAALLLTGCSAETGGNTEPQADAPSEQSPAETPENQAAEETATAVRGQVTVDGTSYDITELRKCEPYSDDTIERELELQGFGEHEGERVQIDVYIETIMGAPYNDVSWAGPEGVYGGPDDANVTLDASGTSVRGVATLFESLTQEDTITVDFDLEVPSETVACR